MKTIRNLTSWGLYLWILFSTLSCTQHENTLPYYNSAEFEPEWIDPYNRDTKKMHTIANFSFLNQNNKVITEKTFQHKIYITDFFFTTCPSICPQMTRNMHALQEHYVNNKNVMLLSHTVAPWIDSVPQLKRYAMANEVDDSKWNLVTGSQEDIYDIARNSYFAEKEIGLQLGTDDFLHTENFILVDHNRHIRGIYNGTIENDIHRLKEDIDILIKEELK